MSVLGKPHGKKLDMTPTEHRLCKVEARLTEDEFANLHGLAKVTDISMTDILRDARNKYLASPKHVVLQKPPPPPKPAAQPKPKLFP